MHTGTGSALRRIQIGNALSAFGNGFTVPYLFIYVARVRELGEATAGASLAAFAVAALLVLPFTGRAIDQRGPLPVVLVGAAGASAGALGFGFAATAPAVLAAAAVMGAGIAVLQPALATMIVWCSTPATRARAFATQFFLANLGLGLGGLTGGLIVDEHRTGSFVLLFATEAVMFLVLGAVIATVRLPRSAPAAHGRTPVAAGGGAEVPVRAGRRRVRAVGRSPEGDGMRAVFANPAMVLLCVLGFVLFFACYGQFEAGLAAYAVEVTRVSPTTLGLALAANTAAIVVAQYAVLRFVERRRRSRVIALVGLIWTVAWLAAAASGVLAVPHAVAVGLLISTYALFGVGEAMLSPTVAPLVADLAPARLIGRYNAAFALVKQLALAIGPAVGGLLAAAGAYGPYLVLVIACSLGVSVLALRLGGRLTPEQESGQVVVTAPDAPDVPDTPDAPGAATAPVPRHEPAPEPEPVVGRPVGAGVHG
ncbi:MFS transporter [Streptomyces otsuchiensis]|uniref:MFS transporter n=1 Tax=Streptomyces otsuchiensis TaxID=2681388 RepID=UPI001476D133|nr:MFS transporter [Streptomyces otsuchiensis]